MTFFVGCAVRLGMWGVSVQHLLRVQIFFFSSFGVLCAGQANRALIIEVHTHRFLDVHSRNKSSCVGAPIRVPHSATECEGEVLILCRAQEMTISDTVCCPIVLFRSICHRLTQCV